MAENRDYITNNLENGTVSINEEVVTTIAAAAVRDVDGVIIEEAAGKLGKKGGKSVHVTLSADSVEVECNLVVLYGHSVVEIAKNVQTGVTSAVESMAGIKVSKVDVNIVGISMSRA